MLNNLRVRSWYYILTTSLAGLCCSVLLWAILSKINRIHGFANADFSAVSIITGAALVASIVTALFINYLRAQRITRLKWFINRPFMWQFILFLLWAIFLSAVFFIANKVIHNDALKLTTNVFQLINSSFGLYVIYLFLRMLFK